MGARIVEVAVPAAQRDRILTKLYREGIDHVVGGELRGRHHGDVVSFVVPLDAVEEVLGWLHDLGVDEDAYVVTSTAETVSSTNYRDLATRYRGLNISRGELRTRAEEMAPALSTFVIMTVVSVLVATTGLLSDSEAVIIGAMIIAPVMGPAISASVGTVLGERALSRRGVSLQVAGVGLAVASAAAFSFVLKHTVLLPPNLDVTTIPTINERLAPNVLSLVLALGAGVAAVVSVSRGVGSVLVGAMIAVALIPPAATVGIGIAWELPLVVFGAGVLVLVNILSVNLAALLFLWYAGYRPERENAGVTRRMLRRRAAALIGMLVALSTILVVVSYLSYASASFDQNATREIHELLAEPEYEGLRALDVAFDYREAEVVFLGKQPVVDVTIDRVPGVETAGVAQALEQHLTRELDQDVIVRARFVDAQHVI